MLHMMIGLQASGKTTFIESHAPKDAVIVSPDRIRQEVFGVIYDPMVEDGVWSLFFRQIEEGLRNKKEVYVDNTCVTKEGRAAIIRLAKRYNVPVIGYWFKIPLEVCLKRNRERDRVVPEYMIHSLYRMFEEPTVEEGFLEIKQIHYKENQGARERIRTAKFRTQQSKRKRNE